MTYYQIHQNGSTPVTTDYQGNEMTNLTYAPYGKPDTVGSANIPYQFNVKEYDSYSGLYYFSFRYYDPFTGRYTSLDYLLGGNMTTTVVFNNYTFCLNNPISFSDPSGHISRGTIIEDIVIVATLTALITTEVAVDTTGTKDEFEK